MKGRPSKPTALKNLAGNAGHRRDDRGDEPAPPPGAPTPPGHLVEAARMRWFEICRDMLNVPGWLTSMDGDALAIYCNATARLTESETLEPVLRQRLHRTRQAKIRGQILNEINMLIGQRKTAIKDIKVFGDALGISPASRTRIRINPGQAELPLVHGEISPFTRAADLARGGA